MVQITRLNSGLFPTHSVVGAPFCFHIFTVSEEDATITESKTLIIQNDALSIHTAGLTKPRLTLPEKQNHASLFCLFNKDCNYICLKKKSVTAQDDRLLKLSGKHLVSPCDFCLQGLLHL